MGAAGAILLAALWGRLNFKMMDAVCQSSARTISMVFFIIISATCFAYVYRALGGDDIVEQLIKEAGLGSWGFLFLVMAIVFFLGFFLDWIEITLIVLPVFSPLIKTLDFGDHVPQADIVYWFMILHGGQPADLVPHAAVRLRALLHQGHRAEGDQDPEHLPGHHPVRDPAAHRPDPGHGLPAARAVADAGELWLRHAKDGVIRQAGVPNRSAERMRRLVDAIGGWGAWLSLPVVIVTCIDVIARKLRYVDDAGNTHSEIFKHVLGNSVLVPAKA